MSLKVIALLLVAAGFILLLWRMFAPGAKAYFDAMGRIPLEDDADTQTLPSNSRPEKE